MRYTRKDFDTIARSVIKDRKEELPQEYKHCPKLYSWELIVEGERLSLAVTFSDHTGMRMRNIAI